MQRDVGQSGEDARTALAFGLPGIETLLQPEIPCLMTSALWPTRSDTAC